MIRYSLIAVLLAVMALPAHAHDDSSRAAVGAGLGAAVGAAIGSELGGRDEAILGGALGGAVGAAIATGDRRARRHDYREYREDRNWRHGHRYEHRRSGPPHCPPGLAKQGRCWR